MSTTNDNTAAEFEADMAFLRGPADFMLENVGARIAYPCEATIYDQLVADLSPAARRNIATTWDEEAA